jgi:hypothetical protein
VTLLLSVLSARVAGSLPRCREADDAKKRDLELLAADSSAQLEVQGNSDPCAGPKLSDGCILRGTDRAAMVSGERKLGVTLAKAEPIAEDMEGSAGPWSAEPCRVLLELVMILRIGVGTESSEDAESRLADPSSEQQMCGERYLRS